MLSFTKAFNTLQDLIKEEKSKQDYWKWWFNHNLLEMCFADVNLGANFNNSINEIDSTKLLFLKILRLFSSGC
jgi:phosphoribosylformylglycinamidine synthase